jgi:hypothetical protein
MVMAEEVAERLPSDAVRVLDPAVFKVIEKVPTPFTSVAEAGRVATESDEVIATVPVYPLAVFPDASFAVTIKLKPVPAVADEGTVESTRELAAAEETAMEDEVTERDPSDAVRVEEPAVLSFTEKEPLPLVRVATLGRVAAESEEVIATVPE